MMELRKAGILMPIFSLPSPYGIGTMGREARVFIDFLSDAGQRLPLFIATFFLLFFW